tara:strand:+ start:4104 stop:4379 length:276 start_codon:yes stop_codon:yes gene_type:complete
MEGKSKYYYDSCRNKECENECDNDCKIPAYYVGKKGMMAKDVCWEFDLSYNIGTAVTYLLRCKRKHETPTNCLKKAIAHIEFEINNIENES